MKEQNDVIYEALEFKPPINFFVFNVNNGNVIITIALNVIITIALNAPPKS